MKDIDPRKIDILPPTDDFVFKSLLTHCNANPVLLDFISCLLGKRLKSVELKMTELPASNISEKQERFDINLEAVLDDDNKKISVELCPTTLINPIFRVEIEMQNWPMTYDNQVNQHKNLTSRSIYLLCDLHSSQNGAGIEFSDLCSSYQVTISHFTVFPNEPRFINEFVLANTQSGKSLDSITLIFVELSNIKLSEILNKKCRRFGAS